MPGTQRLENLDALWEKCISFHGHACEGLAVGFQAAMLVMDALECGGIYQMVCVSETEGCALDAIQAILGCTMGKNTLRVIPRGKRALSFYNLENGKSCRIVQKPLPILPHDVLVDCLLAAKAVDLFDIKPVRSVMRDPADEYPMEPCTACGEPTEEPYLRICKGLPYCLDCLNDDI